MDSFETSAASGTTGGLPLAAPAGSPRHGIVQTRYYPFIDGLRGLAILMVLALHTSVYSEPLGEETLRALITNGGKGVQLFFILSAFTLFSTSFQRFPHDTHPRRDFYIRRAFRILPLWWLCIGVYSFAYRCFGIHFDTIPSVSQAFWDASFLYGFTPAHMRPIVPGGWSLFVEESFYWFLPLLFGYVKNIERAASLTLVLIGVSVAWNPASRVILHGNPLWSTFYFFFPLYQWFIFGLGFVLYFLIQGRSRPALPKPLARLLDLSVGIGLWAALVDKPIGPDLYVASFALVGLCFVASQKDSLWAALLDRPLLRAFGQCCFSIYLFHGLLLRAADPLRRPSLAKLGLTGHPDLGFVVWFLVMASTSFVIGQLSFRLFEKPLVRLGQRTIARLNAPEIVPRVIDQPVILSEQRSHA